MTNADKYLKDGVDVEELTDKILEHNEKSRNCTFYENMHSFWKSEVKPTLTEDEKVILKSMPTYDLIGRADSQLLYVQYKDYCKCGIAPFNHLFQFIKPRRKI